MEAQVYKLKADLFKAIGHPMRVRILEILANGPVSVSELNRHIGAEASHLSQQLGILKRAGIISSAKQGSSVTYFLVQKDVIDLLHLAKENITNVLTEATSVLENIKNNEAASV